METVNLGRVGMVLRGEYNAVTQYRKLDVVTFEGSAYAAKRDTKGDLPTNKVYWQQITLGNKELVTVYAASLLSANWTNKTQTVSVPGLSLASAMVSVDYAAAMTQGQREAVRVAMLSVAGVTNNAVTVLCEGEMPGVDIPIVITEVLA